MKNKPEHENHPSYGTLSKEEFELMKDAPESYYGNKFIEDTKRIAKDRKQRKKKIKPVTQFMFDNDTDGKMNK